MAKMKVDYNLKTSGERFQILCLYLAKIIENISWFALLAKIHLISPSWCSRSIFVWVKAFNLNFSEVLTKREENPRDAAPLTSFNILHSHLTSINRAPKRVLLAKFVNVELCSDWNVVFVRPGFKGPILFRLDDTRVSSVVWSSSGSYVTVFRAV